MRTAGDTSHVRPELTHLNQRTGFDGQDLRPSEAARAYIESRKARIDPRNTTPCTSFVLSASHDWFKGDGPGGFDAHRVVEWTRASQDWLQEKFGDDLVHFSLHLDEKTPHIHAKIIPTTERTTKRGTVIRQVSHHSHPAFAGRRSYEKLLSSYSAAVSHLGLERGDSLPEGARADARTARQWVDDNARNVAADRRQLDRDRQDLNRDALAVARDRERNADTQRHLEEVRRELVSLAEGVERDLEASQKPVSAATQAIVQSKPIPPVARPSPPVRDAWMQPEGEKRKRRKKQGQSGDSAR